MSSRRIWILAISGALLFGFQNCSQNKFASQSANSGVALAESESAPSVSTGSTIDPLSINGMLPEWEDSNRIRFYDGCAANDTHQGTDKICFYGRVETHFDQTGLNGVDGGIVPPTPGTILWPFAVKCQDGRQGVVWGRHQTWNEITHPCEALAIRQLPLSIVYTNTGIKQFNMQGWPGNAIMWFPDFNTDGEYDAVKNATSNDWTVADFSNLCSGSMRTLIVQAEANVVNAPGTIFVRSFGTSNSGIPVTSAVSSEVPGYGTAWVQGNGDHGGETRAGQILFKTTGGVSATLRLKGCGQTGP